ncbi:MAG: HK97 family phage prohead protease [Gemmataceae bacterium]|nr:HK97 family phage prohead protease [Gemmataceae bacterium]
MHTFIASTPSIDSAARTVTHVITAAVADRSGDLIVPAGLANRDEFLRNPVVLWAHQRTLPPIGTCLALEVTADRIIATTKFAAGVPLADDVFRLFEQGILRGWSIGFVPRRAGLRRTTNGHRGLLVESWDLLEYSAVPVPDNPLALTLAASCHRSAAIGYRLPARIKTSADLRP